MKWRKREYYRKSRRDSERGWGLWITYVINYLVNRQLSRKEGRFVIIFIDQKTAFDSVDRAVMIEAIRERGVREGLIERVEEVIRETRSRVRVGGKIGESFWTARGVRQECLLSPLLFILLADLEEEMGRVKWGGGGTEGEKNIHFGVCGRRMLMAEKEKEMRNMMHRLEGYLERKKFDLNPIKTKIMRFRKGGGRIKKKD